MDDQVLKGMARWPNVPAVFGWLALDRRGTWLLQGDPITNPVVTAYIGRNYERDAEGRWFFQNGPQRVYAELEYTPFVYRALNASDRPLELETHTGQRATALSGAWIDEHGGLIVDTEHGAGIVHDRDLEVTLPSMVDSGGRPLGEDALEAAMTQLQQGERAQLWLKLGRWNVQVEALRAADVPAHFGFVSKPEAARTARDMIDLRSDTITRPTEAMLESMREASLGDDSRDGDDTVERLESLAAMRMGKAAAAFMPSGTMTNLVAVLAHTHRGGEVLLEAGSHILNSELGGITAVAGAFYRGIPGQRGAMDVERLREAIRAPTRQNFGTALVCMETTHNRAGGAVLPLVHMQAVHEIASAHGAPVHIDGARIFNASAALRTDARSIAAHGDSVCFCVSKGLSAPIGSLLCGSADFIERARAFRRMVGGNMRQAGPLAAAGILALETMTARLGDDHTSAQRLARGLHAIDPSLVDPAEVETNLVKVNVPREGPPAADWSARLVGEGVRVSPCERYALRFVTHRHVGDPETDAAVEAFSKVWNALMRRR